MTLAPTVGNGLRSQQIRIDSSALKISFPANRGVVSRQKTLLFALMVALSGCGRTFVHDWSPDRVIGTEDGAVVVWKHEVSSGGGFNGFDNNPVLRVRAKYRASAISERNGLLMSSPRRLDYEWRAGESDLFTSYVLEGDLVVVHHCLPDTPPTALSQGQVSCASRESGHAAFAQLGERGEPVLAVGSGFLLLRLSENRACRLDLALLGGDVSKADAMSNDGSRFGVAVLPTRSLVYVVDRTTPDLSVLVSSGCAPLERIAGLREWQATDLPSDTEQFHESLEVVDIVPGRDPGRPSVLVTYTQRLQGAYRERLAVIDLAAGRLRQIEAWEGGAIGGFWMSQPDRVWELDFLSSHDRSADFRIYDVATSRVRTERVHFDAD